MRKLLIVDDEKIIRETIAALIDWAGLGIKLIGTAKDGIEAYHIILDEYPDIVLTDIKMPGFSGLELIQRIHDISSETHFIILSGFGEFEYAKRAMQYGVKHYLLKPCNEQQIVSTLKQVLHELAQATAEAVTEPVSIKGYYSNLMTGILNVGLSLSSHTQNTCNTIFDSYRNYIDFDTIPYEIFYIYYLTYDYFQSTVEKISSFFADHFPTQVVYFIYVRNTLLFYTTTPEGDLHILYSFLDSLFETTQAILPEYKQESFSNLSCALKSLLPHIRKYEQIFFTEGSYTVSLYNYQNIIKEVQVLTEYLYSENSSVAGTARSTLFHTLSSISDAAFLRQLAASAVIYSVSKATSFDMVRAAEFLVLIGQEKSCPRILELLIQQLNTLYEDFHSEKSIGDISKKIQLLVNEHIQNSELSLKWIAENHLFMNVDYLSKRFLKETGMKFSKYLTDVRILQAKKILATGNANSIQCVAELVGCGNNPQYFSQIFKKETGMTPSKYVKMVHDRA